MLSVVAALEVSDKLQTVGAFAGFAAILGLAVMSVLYFGQAREVKRLREWAGRAPERAAEMQDRVSADAQRKVVAQPVAQPRPPAAQPATPGAAAAGAGAAAAAVRPATATPAAAPGAGAAAPGAAGVPGAAAAGAAGVGAPGGAGAAPAGAPGQVPPPAGTPTVAGRQPAVDGDGDGDTDQPTVLQRSVGTPPPAADTPSPATPAGGATPAPAARPEPAVPLRPAASARAQAAAPSRQQQQQSSSPAGATIAIVAAVAAIIVAVLLVVTGVIGGGGDGGAKDKAARTNQIVPTTPSTTTTSGSTATPAVQRSKVSLVVLNGTGVTNLARNAKDKLISDGFTTSGAGDRGDSTIATTAVLYGQGGQRAARLVARLLEVPAANVKPLDAGTQAVARTFAADPNRNPAVVVVLGADKAQQQ